MNNEYISLVLSHSYKYIKENGILAFLCKLWSKIVNSIYLLLYSNIPNIYRFERSAYKKTIRLKEYPFIDILIVTYNSDSHIRTCLNSLCNMNYNLQKVNIVIADNNSTDNTTQAIHGFLNEHATTFNNINLITNNNNIGFGPAINQASKRYRSEYIFILNPDTRVDSNCLNILTSYAVADSKCAIWEARQLPYEHPKFYCPITFETIWSSGAAILVNRSIFETVNGFDEQYYLYVEDVDLSLKIRSLGYCCRYIPEAIVEHYINFKSPHKHIVQFYYSIRNNLILRIKIGSYLDILKGYLQVLFIIIKQTVCLDPTIKATLKAFFCHFQIIRKTVLKRKTVSNEIKFNYNFFFLDYEFKKRGDSFYQTIPTKFPLVSIIMRSLGKNDSFVYEAIQSVINQTYKNIEIILIEDRSNNLIELTHSLKKNGIRFKYFSNQNSSGRSHSGNIGIELSTGEFINFLDEDDLLYPTHVDTIISQLLKNPSFKAAYAASVEAKIDIINDTTGKYRIVKLNHYFNAYNKQILLEKNLFPIQSVIFHRSLYNEMGGFNEELFLLEDWELWIRYSRLTDFLPIDITTSEFRTPADTKKAKARITALRKYKHTVTNMLLRK